jgi:hypothetical protein
LLEEVGRSGLQDSTYSYWNLSQYAGSPEKAVSANVGLISGFSTAILKAVFSGTDFSPRAIMLRALEKYSEVVVPR